MNLKDFLFGPYPLALESIDRFFLYDALIALTVSLIITAALRSKGANPVAKTLLKKLRSLGFWYGLLGLLWVGFRYENALYLNWRFWPVLLALLATVWLIKIIIYRLKDYPKELAAYRNSELKKKYLR